MAREKLLTAALAVLAEWEAEQGGMMDDRFAVAMDRLALATYRRCETCERYSPPQKPFLGSCNVISGFPPRDLDDTCARWKEKEDKACRT